jgi:hypothetical protein
MVAEESEINNSFTFHFFDLFKGKTNIFFQMNAGTTYVCVGAGSVAEAVIRINGFTEPELKEIFYGSLTLIKCYEK